MSTPTTSADGRIAAARQSVHRQEAERLLEQAEAKLRAWRRGEQLGALMHDEAIADLAAAQVHALLSLGPMGGW